MADVEGCSEAKQYVESIMGTQTVTSATVVETPMPRKKRHLSLPDIEASSKKVRGKSESDNESQNTAGRAMAQARRSLYGRTPRVSKVFGNDTTLKLSDNSGKDCAPQAEVQSDCQGIRDSDLTSLLKTISGDRIDQLEARLEKKLSDKVAQIIDKRFNSESRRLRSDISSRVGEFKSEFQSDVDNLISRFESLVETVNSCGQSTADITLNVVIRDLPEHEGENTLAKVNSLITDKLNIHGVCATSAVRKKSSGPKAGVVIATFGSTADKEKVMKAKKLLRNTNFKNVYLHNDQSHTDTLLSQNMRLLVNAINNGDSDILLRGNRVVRNTPRNGESGSRKDRTGGESSEKHGPYASGTGNGDYRGKGRGEHRGGQTSSYSNRDSGKQDYRSLFGNDGSHRGGGCGSGNRGGNTGEIRSLQGVGT